MEENTTIKLRRKTKERLDSFKEYKRETYEEILEKILEILNICKANPLKSRAKLMGIDRRHKENMQKNRKKEHRQSKTS
jgi:hypothetical protein